MLRRLATSALASSVDRLVAQLAFQRAPRPSEVEALDFDARMETLAALEARHRQPEWTAPPEVLFGEAGEAGAWETSHVRALDGGEVLDVRWRSGYVPLAREPEVLARMRRVPDNDWAHARLWLHERPRPAVLLLHGYLGGSYPFEERAWPMRWMFERLGLDLALPVLPHHGPRKGGRRRPLFPSNDPRLTVEGFRQAAWDLLSLRRALTARGAPAVGAMGMSLGGYTTSLALTADDGLAFGVPFIPLASLADFARDGGRLVGLPSQRRAQHEAIERAHAPVSPLSRRPRVSPEAILVVGGRADKITPASHAERLAAHFEAPLHLFEGGHLLQVGRDEAFREIARMLRGLDLLSPR